MNPNEAGGGLVGGDRAQRYQLTNERKELNQCQNHTIFSFQFFKYIFTFELFSLLLNHSIQNAGLNILSMLMNEIKQNTFSTYIT